MEAVEKEAYALKLSNYAAQLIGSPRRLTALAMLRRAAEMTKTAGVHTNLAISLMGLGVYDESSQILQRLTTENAVDLAAWHAYGVLGLIAAQPEIACQSFRQCRIIEPKILTHRFDHSCALMQANRWVEGWELYETRRDHKPERSFPGLRRWDGSEGKSVYVWAEQGIGDTLQFARYLPLLRQKSKRVVFAVPPSLFKLFAGYKEVCDIMMINTAVDDIECETPLMSLPQYLGPAPDTWPADPGLLANDIKPLTLDKPFKVGLCWAVGGTSHNHLERSVPFSQMVGLVENSAASFYSLQVGHDAGALQENDAQLLVTDLNPLLTDEWHHTAAAIKSMDMVVSTDTSVAHLAAILGKPTIMLLARRDWWRWGNAGSTTPWYPTMTIIRQKRPFYWEDEIKTASALVAQAAEVRNSQVELAA